MERALPQLSPNTPAPSELQQSLRRRLKGEVRFDPLSRTIYATDASMYEILPLGVVLPKDVDDVVAVVDECRSAGTSVIARGGGTGLTGGAVGPGVQIDVSRHMNRIGHFDCAARTIEVEPGVVLDELNAFLAPHDLHFAPDVATSSRATIGGMIANNSCGAHSVIYGRTVDHVRSLKVVLFDSTVATFDVSPPQHGNPAQQLEAALARIRDTYYDEIVKRFPKVMRSNGGYGLDRLGPPGTRADARKVLCGSEGTLGVVVGAILNLVSTPKHKGVVVLHFANVLDSLTVTPAALQHRPAAIELVDRLILSAGRSNLALSKRCDFLHGDPGAILIVEFFANDASSLAAKIDALTADPAIAGACLIASKVLDTARQADVWNLRKSGLGLLMSRPGDMQPQAFVEDTAVDPARLREYIERFSAVLQREDVTAGYFAHASVGCLHVRPVVNLKDPCDVQRMRRIADAVSDLALEFGGAMTGEHGDGIVRSCWIEKMYGPRITAAFHEVKKLFDPDGILNPHKIVDPWPMTEHLRYSAQKSREIKTQLDFSAHGGMAGLAGMCSGIGQCRQRLVGTMCPSYMATHDEQHTTRARANALRAALTNHGSLAGLDDPHLEEVMDLCLSCKACKTECPTSVDMARLKSEYLSHMNLLRGAGRQARFIADLPRFAAHAACFPRLSNVLGQSKLVRAFMEGRYGLDRRMPPPRFAAKTFRRWFHGHRPRGSARLRPRGTVVYFVDTWTNYFTPQVGIAAVTLLEHAGFDVICPETLCCGRPAISKGLLAEAATVAEANIAHLAHVGPANAPILGTEPSCVFTLVDEYPQLVRTQMARKVASRTMMVETFLRRVLEDEPTALGFPRPNGTPLLYHAHCHQKALVGSEDAVALLRRTWGERASEINSGCCGMAGSFGHEKEHYEVAKAVGEQRLFPAIRNRGDAAVAVSGFSCRHQIEHHTGAHPYHVVEHLAAWIE